MNRKIFIWLAGWFLLAGDVAAEPLYDPFLERFQVGTYGDPDGLVLEGGFPADLLEPVTVDTVWTAAARRVLAGRAAGADSFLIHRILVQPGEGPENSGWLSSMAVALDQLESGVMPDLPDQGVPPLAAERAARRVFHHLQAGRLPQAAAGALRMRDEGEALGLSPREIFVWDLRTKLLTRLADSGPAAALDSWPTMLDLGPFDSGNAWALWMGFCRATGNPCLPAAMTTEKWGRHLAGLGSTWLSAQELYRSGLPEEFKAGLGAVMFKGAVRDTHFLMYPDPPADSDLQGLWVRGKRLQSRGSPAAYEKMAARGDLLPGWRMDVWRRASELRLLKDEWETGLEDLRQALVLAGQGLGHWTTRRRLRQWNEQALVLALAREDLTTARKLLDLGLEHFQDGDREAFLSETRHWKRRLDPETNLLDDVGEELPCQAQAVVESGRVVDIGPADEPRRLQFRLATGQTLWALWARWGMALANPEPVQGLKRERALVYGNALAEMMTLPDPAARESAALRLVSARLGENPVFPILLEQAFDRDVGLASGWRTPPRPSAIPGLLAQLRGSELDRHALLGFALALGDMRGILAVANELEGRGLTPEEKRRFLYPLPDSGAIFAAILEAESDPALLLAIARNESLFEPSVRSRAGALGWMQIMPVHYEERGALPGEGNWRNPRVSIRHGDLLLQENSRRYDGNPYQAVAAYNAGPAAATRWEQQLGGSPARDIYLAWIGYPETRHYVEMVLIDREIYDWIIRSESPD